MLDITRIHLQDLILRRRPQDLDDLDELVDSARTREEDGTAEEFAEDAAGGPEVCEW